MDNKDILDVKTVTLANGRLVQHKLYRDGDKIMEDREVLKASPHGGPDTIDHMIVEAPPGMTSYN